MKIEEKLNNDVFGLWPHFHIGKPGPETSLTFRTFSHLQNYQQWRKKLVKIKEKEKLYNSTIFVVLLDDDEKDEAE